MSFKEPFLFQIQSHKKYTPQDAVKLCYQASFGPQHMLKNPEQARSYLQEECHSLTPAQEPLFEEISEELVRLNLRPWIGEGLSIDWLFSLFRMTAELPQKGETAFHEYVSDIRRISSDGLTPFSLEEFDAWYQEYLSGGIRAVSHSTPYHDENQPAYRLISTRYLNLIPILKAFVSDPQIRVIAIDGMAGSGKTTLANDLQSFFGCSVIRMDDFFLPLPLRTPERTEETGGNIHYERFLEEVVPYVSRREGFSYRKFNCSVMDYGAKVFVEPGFPRIVEGSYSCHPLFGDFADLRIFVETEPELQMERILHRDIPLWMVDRFRETWIPMENCYHAKFALRDRADIIIQT